MKLVNLWKEDYNMSEEEKIYQDFIKFVQEQIEELKNENNLISLEDEDKEVKTK